MTHPRMTQYVANNYIPVPETGCWLWLGTWTHFGHGRLSSNGKSPIVASRLFYEHFTGPIPDGKFVCHKCDTPPCCNPDHLFLGTHSENMNDMKRKRRSRAASGEFNSSAKLNAEQVKTIFSDRRCRAAISHDYGISSSTVTAIKQGKSWKHLCLRDNHD